MLLQEALNVASYIALSIVVATLTWFTKEKIRNSRNRKEEFDKMKDVVYGVEGVEAMEGLVEVMEAHDESIDKMDKRLETMAQKVEDDRERIELLEERVDELVEKVRERGKNGK